MGRALEGRVAVVTGASRGIGRAIAHRFAAEGADVAICSRPTPAMGELGTLEAAADELRGLGAGVLAVPLDLLDPDADLDGFIDLVTTSLGPVDILVNNAAAGGFKPFMDWTDAQIDKALLLNLRVPWRLIRAVLPGMRERGSGSILNLSSATARPPAGPPFPDTAPARMGTIYGGTKAMLDRWTASLAVELLDDGIGANTLAPQAAAATEVLVAHSNLAAELYEPLETMAEAALALVSADPRELTGRITTSLELLVELDRQVMDLEGAVELVDWAPATLPARIEAMDAHAKGELSLGGPSNVPDLVRELRG